MARLKSTDRVWLAGIALAAVVGLAAIVVPPVYCALWGATDLRCVGSWR